MENTCLNDSWRWFNIMDGIGDTSITWEEVTIQCMSGLGQKQLTEFTLNAVGFDVIVAPQEKTLPFAKEIDFKTANSKSVVELFASQSQSETLQDELARRFTLNNVNQASSLIDETAETFQDNDPS